MFITFIVMILLISFNLTYYTVFAESSALNLKIQHAKDTNECGNSNNFSASMIPSVLFKFVICFFAGGIVADPRFIKLGLF